MTHLHGCLAWLSCCPFADGHWSEPERPEDCHKQPAQGGRRQLLQGGQKCRLMESKCRHSASCWCINLRLSLAVLQRHQVGALYVRQCSLCWSMMLPCANTDGCHVPACRLHTTPNRLFGQPHRTQQCLHLRARRVLLHRRHMCGYLQRSQLRPRPGRRALCHLPGHHNTREDCDLVCCEWRLQDW